MDIAAVSAAYGQTGGMLEADINGDGKVDIMDRIFTMMQQGTSIDPSLPLDD